MIGLERYLSRLEVIMKQFGQTVVGVVPACMLWFLMSAPLEGATVTNSLDDSSGGTLRELIAAATSGDTIDFDAAVTHITLTQGQLTLGKSLTIDGAGAVTINGGGTNRIFYLSGNPRTWNLYGLTLTNGAALGSGEDGKGGAIYIWGWDHSNVVTISNCVIQACVASDLGGGVYGPSGSEAASVTVRDTVVSGNTADTRGGGFSLNIKSDMANTTVSNNLAGEAGAMFLQESDATSQFEQVTFVSNAATNGMGGACIFRDALLRVDDCAFHSNSATAGGGAINFRYYQAATNANDVIFSNCTITANSVTNTGGSGGGVYIDSGPVQFIGCTIASNNAAQNGGGIYVWYEDAGIYMDGQCILRACDLFENEATRGGGIYNGWNSSILEVLESTLIHGNSAADAGGGIATAASGSPSPTVTVRNSSIYANTAANSGGGIHMRHTFTAEGRMWNRMIRPI